MNDATERQFEPGYQCWVDGSDGQCYRFQHDTSPFQTTNNGRTVLLNGLQGDPRPRHVDRARLVMSAYKQENAFDRRYSVWQASPDDFSIANLRLIANVSATNMQRVDPDVQAMRINSWHDEPHLSDNDVRVIRNNDASWCELRYGITADLVQRIKSRMVYREVV